MGQREVLRKVTGGNLQVCGLCLKIKSTTRPGSFQEQICCHLDVFGTPGFGRHKIFQKNAILELASTTPQPVWHVPLSSATPYICLFCNSKSNKTSPHSNDRTVENQESFIKQHRHFQRTRFPLCGFKQIASRLYRDQPHSSPPGKAVDEAGFEQKSHTGT